MPALPLAFAAWHAGTLLCPALASVRACSIGCLQLVWQHATSRLHHNWFGIYEQYCGDMFQEDKLANLAWDDNTRLAQLQPDVAREAAPGQQSLRHLYLLGR